MTERREVLDGDGVWGVVTHPSGVVSRTLVEPSDKYLAAREAEQQAELTRRQARAQAVVDRIEGLERANSVAQLRSYLVEREKERLGYEKAREVLSDG